LWRAIRRIQEDCLEFGYSVDLALYDINAWTRQSVQAYVDRRLEGILQSYEPEALVDVEKSVERAVRMAATAEGGPSVAPAAVAYATDRLRSKVRRDAVANPVSTAYGGLVTHAHLKAMRGSDVVYLDVYNLSAAQETTEPPIAPPKGKDALQWLGEMSLDLNGQWLIKKLFPRVGVVSVFGDSRSFKTFLLVHASYCVALGRNFASFKIKNAGPIVYIAAEDAAGARKRVLGYHMAKAKDLPPRTDIPIAVVDVAPNLGKTPGDAKALIREIEKSVKDRGFGRPSMVVIDTLNQTLGDADENGPGMQAFMSNATEIARKLQCCVVSVTHVGHNEKGRERGGSQIKGNADGRFLVVRALAEPVIENGAKTYETQIGVEKVKNGEDGFGMRVKLEEIVIGVDEDGDDVTTLVVTGVERKDSGDGATKAEPGDKAEPRSEELRRDFLDAYHYLATETETQPGFDGKPVRKVPVDAIKRRMIDRGRLIVGDNGKLLHREVAAFSRVRLSLTRPGKHQSFVEGSGQIWKLEPFSFRPGKI
jgi:hypothetical protein